MSPDQAKRDKALIDDLLAQQATDRLLSALYGIGSPGEPMTYAKALTGMSVLAQMVAEEEVADVLMEAAAKIAGMKR